MKAERFVIDCTDVILADAFMESVGTTLAAWLIFWGLCFGFLWLYSHCRNDDANKENSHEHK